MIDLDAVERQLARDPLCSEANMPDLVAELRAAREVIEKTRNYWTFAHDQESCTSPLCRAVVAYDKVIGEVAG